MSVTRSMGLASARVALAFLAIHGGAIVADVKTYTGPNPGDWDTAANWTPEGVPGDDDDVKIPNGFEVRVDGNKKRMNSLEVGVGGKLVGKTPGTSVVLTISGDCAVLAGGNIGGANGGTNQPGGSVTITAGGKITIAPGATVTGGDGGNGNLPGNGGGVTLDGGNLDNDGEERGGKGGNHTNPGGTGANGGSIRNVAHNPAGSPAEPGTKLPGARGNPNGTPGTSTTITGPGGQARLRSGDLHNGLAVTISAPSGTVSLQGVGGLVLDADEVVDIHTDVLDLRGNSAGTLLVRAGASIQLAVGSILLDPGVSVNDLMSPAPSIVAPVPASPQAWLLAFALAALTCGAWSIHRMRAR